MSSRAIRFGRHSCIVFQVHHCAYTPLACLQHLLWQPKPPYSTHQCSVDVDGACKLLDLVLPFALSELFPSFAPLGWRWGLIFPIRNEYQLTFLEQLEVHSIGCLRFLQRPICLRALSSQLNHSSISCDCWKVIFLVLVTISLGFFCLFIVFICIPSRIWLW